MSATNSGAVLSEPKSYAENEEEWETWGDFDLAAHYDVVRLAFSASDARLTLL